MKKMSDDADKVEEKTRTNLQNYNDNYVKNQLGVLDRVAARTNDPGLRDRLLPQTMQEIEEVLKDLSSPL